MKKYGEIFNSIIYLKKKANYMLKCSQGEDAFGDFTDRIYVEIRRKDGTLKFFGGAGLN